MSAHPVGIAGLYDRPRRQHVERAPALDRGSSWSTPWLLPEAARQRQAEAWRASRSREAGTAEPRCGDAPLPPQFFGEVNASEAGALLRRLTGRAIGSLFVDTTDHAPRLSLTGRRQRTQRCHQGGNAWRVRGHRARELGERAWSWLDSGHAIAAIGNQTSTHETHHMIHRWENDPRPRGEVDRRPHDREPSPEQAIGSEPARGIVIAALLSMPVWAALLLLACHL
jgi:hypothetical protein